MAQLLIAAALETGITTGKFILRRLSDGAFWSTAGTPAFEAYSAGSIANYGIAATETGATGIYTATNPSELTPARAYFVKAAGASLAVSDLVSNLYHESDAGGPSIDGKTLPEALQIIGAATAGKLSGAGTATEVMTGLDGSTTRITGTVDSSGNRTAATYG